MKKDLAAYIKNITKPELIISLTTYPARIRTVCKAVESLLSQTKKADRIILWLAQEQFPNKEADLPDELLALKDRGLTISWCEDIRSYKKLIPALKEYPEAVIVTADDDILYPPQWLEKLYNAYLENPQMAHCHRAHRPVFKKGKIGPYQKWHMGIPKAKPSFLNFLTGCGGALYPPGVFYKDIADKERFMSLCPAADDVWFWAMLVLNGVKINIIKNADYKLNEIKDAGGNALWHTNILRGKNDEQLSKVFAQYPSLRDKLKEEYKNAAFENFIMDFKTFKWLYCTHKEPGFRVYRILGVKFKLKK